MGANVVPAYETSAPAVRAHLGHDHTVACTTKTLHKRWSSQFLEHVDCALRVPVSQQRACAILRRRAKSCRGSIEEVLARKFENKMKNPPVAANLNETARLDI